MQQFLLYITFLQNNIIITLSEKILNLVKPIVVTRKTTSSGAWGFTNKQKNTPFACIFMLKKFNIPKTIHIIFKGDSFFRYLVLYVLKKENITLLSISENTPISYNGCKYSRKKIVFNE